MKFIFLFLSVLGFAMQEPLDEAKFWLYLGTDLGWAKVSPDVATEKNRSGYQFDFKALGSFYTPRWIFDLGGGWFYNHLVDEPSISTYITRAGFVEFSPRYRLTDKHWQLGPALRFLFGTDVSFSERIDINSKTTSSLLGGLRVDYEIPKKNHNFRIGAQALTDLGIENRTVWLVQLDLQIGWDFSSESEKEPSIFDNTAPSIEPPAPPEKEYVRVSGKENVDLTLDELRGIYFDFDSAKLRSSSKPYLKKLAIFLKKNSKAWKTLVIEGHTDNRGDDKYNLKLSDLRAKSVKSEIVSHGVQARKIRTIGYGESRPINIREDEEGWQENRRVELKFYGVKNPQWLVKKIIELQNH